MMKRFCDRCAAEMPMEQTLDERDFILRRVNGKPYDQCEKCQYSLKKWAAAAIDEWFENKKLNAKKCSCYHVEWGDVPHCWGTKENEVCDCEGDERRCNFYADKRNKTDMEGK